MKTSKILFGLLAIGGVAIAAGISACGSDDPLNVAGGGNGSGSGGTSSGSGGTSSGSGGSSAVTGAGIKILQGGFVTAGSWKGYAFTAGVKSTAAGAAETTISPVDFASVAEGGSLCATGSIGAASDYGGVAMIGQNVNQEQSGADGGDQAVNEVAIGGSGVTITYTNAGKTTIRVQIQTKAGENDPTGRWCATLSGNGGTETVKWDAFWGGDSDTTKGCWSSTGNHPAVGTMITQVALLVPGGNTAAVAFDMCMGGAIQAP